jgi:Lrp/AsnC family transcriptional regulator, regulator for asnA, asnC and gidA
MARLIETSVQTIRNRIDRMTEAGVFTVRAILNPPGLGFDRDAIMGLRVRQGCLKSVADKLSALENVSYVGFIAGGFDLMIEVYVRDDEHLFHFLTEELAAIKEIEGTEVWTVLRTQKFNYGWANPWGDNPPAPPAEQ